MFASAIAGSLAELLLDERERPLGRPVIEPGHQAEREEVLRALCLARGDPVNRLQRLDGHGRQRDLVHMEALERAVAERVLGVAGLLQVALVERVGVDDQRAALGRSCEVRLQRRRVHRHEHVRLVARREDVVVGEVHLEAGDAGQRAGRGADLGREVRQRREVVAHHRRLAREPVARQLHAVAGIAGEPDDHTIELLDRLGAHWPRLRIRLLNGTGRAAGTVASSRVLRTNGSGSNDGVGERADACRPDGIARAPRGHLRAPRAGAASTDPVPDPARARRARPRIRHRAFPRSSCHPSSC